MKTLAPTAFLATILVWAGTSQAFANSCLPQGQYGPLAPGQSYCPPDQQGSQGDDGSFFGGDFLSGAAIASGEDNGGHTCTPTMCFLENPPAQGDGGILDMIKGDAELQKIYDEALRNPQPPYRPEFWAEKTVKERMEQQAADIAKAIAKEGAQLPDGYTITNLPDGRIQICGPSGDCPPFDPKNPPAKYLAGLKKLQGEIKAKQEEALALKKKADEKAKEDERKRVADMDKNMFEKNSGNDLNGDNDEGGTTPGMLADGSRLGGDEEEEEDSATPGLTGTNASGRNGADSSDDPNGTNDTNKLSDHLVAYVGSNEGVKPRVSGEYDPTILSLQPNKRVQTRAGNALNTMANGAQANWTNVDNSNGVELGDMGETISTLFRRLWGENSGVELNDVKPKSRDREPLRGKRPGA
ncbi:MAG: hypothetical protein HY927_05775 [Elusimicrobia bacterium]|nr:hypothetical protein [Elusimicrobiota bacterium]